MFQLQDLTFWSQNTIYISFFFFKENKKSESYLLSLLNLPSAIWVQYF